MSTLAPTFRATCNHCSFSGTVLTGREHETTNHGHTVTVWDGPTSQIPRAMWATGIVTDPPVLGDDATAAAAETARATSDLTSALIRLVLAHPGSGDPEDAYEHTVFKAAETLGVDLHTALLGYFERVVGE